MSALASVTAGQWFMLSGVCVFAIGAILLAMAVRNLARARRLRRRPVRVIRNARLHEVTILPGAKAGYGFEVLDETRVMPRQHRRQ